MGASGTKGLVNTVGLLALGALLWAGGTAFIHRVEMQQPPAMVPVAPSSTQQRVSPQPRSLPTTSGHLPIEQPLPKPPPPPPPLPLTPTLPSSGVNPSLHMVIEQCVRNMQTIDCWGTLTNNTDAFANTYLGDSYAVDDEGNTIRVFLFGGGISFSGGGSGTNLIPGVPTKFLLHIADEHMGVKSINVELNVGNASGSSVLVLFKDIPVQ